MGPLSLETKLKTGTKFRDTAQVGEHTEKLLRQKQGWDTHLERKGVGVLPNEEERTREVIQITYIGQFFRVFVYLWPVISFLFPHLTCSRTLSNPRAHLWTKWIPAQRPMGRLTSPILGWRLLLFWQGAILCMCSRGGLLDLKNEKYVVSLSFIQAGLNSYLLLPSSLSWSVCPQGTDSSCSAWGPSISSLSLASLIRRWQWSKHLREERHEALWAPGKKALQALCAPK